MDYRSESIAVLLKRETASIHEQLEHSPGAGWLSRGELDKTEYICYLMMLWKIYSLLEGELERWTTSDSVVGRFYDSNVLARAGRLSSDLESILATPSWQSHPSFKRLNEDPPQALLNYLNRLRQVASTHPELLLAHAYVRYLGDMSGGQYIKRRVQRAYSLNDDQLEFYHFGDTNATGEHQRIKQQFKQEMNDSVPNDDVELKQQLVEEANIAFGLNLDIFNGLKEPSVIRDPMTVPGSLAPVNKTNFKPSLLEVWPITFQLRAYEAGSQVSRTTIVSVVFLALVARSIFLALGLAFKCFFAMP